MEFLNGHKKALGVAATVTTILVGVCSIFAYFSGIKEGWARNVEARVVEQRMVNAHDETLKEMVPKVDACHEVNLRQQFGIEQNTRDITALAESVKKTNEIVQAYVQSMMREGRVPR